MRMISGFVPSYFGVETRDTGEPFRHGHRHRDRDINGADVISRAFRSAHPRQACVL